MCCRLRTLVAATALWLVVSVSAVAVTPYPPLPTIDRSNHIQKIRIGNGKLFVLSDYWYGITVTTGESFTVPMPPAEYAVDILDIAVEHADTTYAPTSTSATEWYAVRTAFGTQVWKNTPTSSGPAWEQLEVDDRFRVAANPVQIVPTGTDPIFISFGNIWLPNSIEEPSPYPRKGDAKTPTGYRTILLPPERAPLNLGALGNWPSQALYFDHRLILGFNPIIRDGKGAGLFSVDIHKGEFDAHKNKGTPMVVNHVLRHGDHVWSSFGDVTNWVKHSELWRFNARGRIDAKNAVLSSVHATSLSKTSNFDLPPSVMIASWPIGPPEKATRNYRSTKSKANGYWVLSQEHGLLRHTSRPFGSRKASWTIVSQQWGIETAFDWKVIDNQAWIATRTEGLFVMDLSTGQYSPVPFRPATAPKP